MADVGDKFVIEIDKVFKESENGNKLYRIKGFNSLVFDENGIRKLNELSTILSKRTIDQGSVWRCVAYKEEEICVFSTDESFVYGINRNTRHTFVLSIQRFLLEYEKLNNDFSNEIGVILGDLPF